MKSMFKSFMQRFAILVSLCFCVAHVVAENKFFIQNFSIAPGETKDVNIILENTDQVSAFQADIYLPEALAIVKQYDSDMEEDVDFMLTSRKSNNHDLLSVVQTDGAYRLLCNSQRGKFFSGSEGALVTFKVKANESFTGEAEIRLSNILFTDPVMTKYPISDCACTVRADDGKYHWSYDEATKTLTISGKGPMDDYWILDNVNTPWADKTGDVTSVIVEEGITVIGHDAFCSMKNLTTVKLPETLKRMKESSFHGCSSLQSIELPSNLEWIEDYAFASCNLQSIAFPASLKDIGCHAFQSNENLTSVAFAEGLISIGVEAFSKCNLHSVTLPSTLQRIGEKAFYENANLTSIVISQGVTEMGRSIVAKCEKLTSITVAEGNTMYSSLDGALYDKGQTILYQYPVGKEEDEFVVPSTVTTLDYDAFSFSHLKTLTLPKAMQNLNDWSICMCTSLTDLYCYAKEVPTTAENAFNDTPLSSITLHVPASAIEAYKASASWGRFGTIVAIDVEEEYSEEIAELRSKVAEALELYNNSVEGEQVGQYQAGSRAALLAVINEVNDLISDTMDEATINDCLSKLADAVEEFQSQIVIKEKDTDISLLDNVIYIEPFEAVAGQQVKLSVKMKNNVEVKGFQFDLYLPEGVTVATDEDGFALAELSLQRTTKNKTDYFGCNIQSDGAFRVLCGSTKGYTFNDTDGEVCTIMLNIAEDMEDGDFPVILKTVEMTDKGNSPYTTDYLKSTLTISSYTLGDANNDGKVTITDFMCAADAILGNVPAIYIDRAADFNNDGTVTVSDLMSLADYILSGAAPAKMPARVRQKVGEEQTENYIYLEPVTAARGGQQTLSVKMKNSESIKGYQADIYLPDGMTFAQDEDDFYLAEMSTARTTKNKTDYFGCNIQSDGALRLLCGSTKGYTFSGNDGEVATVVVNVSDEMAEGDYSIILRNVELTNVNNMPFTNAYSESKLTITDGEETYEEGYSLSIADFSMDVDGDFEASVMMENVDAVKSIEFDMVLPNGLTVENEEGEYFINLGSRVTSSTVRNQFSGWGEENPDGSIHFTAKFNRTTSTYQFTGNEGEALTMLFIAEGVTDGFYEVQLKNIVLNGDLKVAPSTVTVKVGNPSESVDVTLEDGVPYTGDTEKECNTLTYTRTFNNTNWQALYVPFQMSYEDWAEDFEVAKINNFHQFDTDGDDVYDDLRMEILKVKNGTLKQNHPYLIRAKSTGVKSITLNDATLYAAEENSFMCNSMETTYTFTGTYSGLAGDVVYDNNYYSMGGGALILAEDATVGLKPYRWFLKMESRDGQILFTPNNVPVMIWDEETNSIETLSQEDGASIVYSIDGRAIKNLKARGIYIVNGKKVLR